MILFEKPGKGNTEEVMCIASRKAEEDGIDEIVIASSAGFAAREALKVFDAGKNRVVVVTGHAGFEEPFRNDMDDETIGSLEERGARVLTCSHALSGIERSFRRKHGGIYPAEIVAETLRVFGQGVKVCIEIAIMAADAGLLSGKPCICIGGTGHGADAAVVLTPANMNRFLDLRVHEILCKPHL